MPFTTSRSSPPVESNYDFLVDVFAPANNPAIYTVYYNKADQACISPDGYTQTRGCNETCAEAYIYLETDFAVGDIYTTDLNNRCANMGYDPTNPTDMLQCKTVWNNTTLNLLNFVGDTAKFQTQMLLTEAFNNALITASPDQAMALATARSGGNSMLSAGMAANSWIPIIKGIMLSTAILLTPILCLFIPTPLGGKAISTIAGFFVWLTCWGVIDAALHGAAMSMALQVMQDVTSYKLGLVAVANFGTASAEVLSIGV